ncbi:GAF sensor hybrid histidine kinase [Crinalium epipsammum PCC 9333]|uniref:histidine kinase n=1 Tax=Crinalium epipsammum PCC 9333 TaxID=1173022 RepID=K9VVH0_9CYAN|nr:hybrid sensor histidine kinase/response regulator [Crinalium epipsammum]AFZ11976.1 GAF sensor hybrid histidine kinase [Crinalium epipsammum PCC 9333]
MNQHIDSLNILTNDNNPSPQSTLVLVIDDEKMMRKQLRKALEQVGYQVTEASSAEEGLALYRSLMPDLILLDALMPGMDGFTCCKILRSFPECEYTPILMITSLEDEESVDMAFAAGASDYITKPLHWGLLRQRVRCLLNAGKAMQELRQQSERERLIRKITEGIRQSLNLEEILHTTVTGVREFLGCDRVVFYRVWSDGSGEVVSEAVVDDVFIITGREITDPCFQSSYLELYRQGRVYAIADIDQANLNPCYTEFLHQFDVKAHLVVPILQGNDFWGLLIAHHCTASRHWSSVNIELLKELALQVSIALAQANYLKTIQDNEGKLRQLLEKEKELSALKSRFVTMTSHEFRTPMSTILSSTELLEHFSHKLSEEKKSQHFQRIQSAIKNMTQLLEDVLVFGKAEAGKLELKPICFDVKQFCQELVEEMRLNSGSQYLMSFVAQSDDTNVFMDEKILYQILNNLLSNAIKYSPKGGKINFDLVCENNLAIFTIKDQGIGIPQAEQVQLFNSFYRGSNVGGIAGTGLGLAIVKKCVDLQGGVITVNSQVGVGTTFTVTIPSAPQLQTRQTISYLNDFLNKKSSNEQNNEVQTRLLG